MDKILDMMKEWSPIGQGLFLLFVLGMSFSFINGLFRCFVALFRGWPPPECECEEDDEETKQSGN